VPARAPRGSGSLLDLAIGAITLVAIGAAAYFGVITYLSPPPQPVPASPVVATIKPVAAQLTWTDADAKRCQSKAVSAANAPMPMDTALANRSVTEGFAGLSTRLECQLLTKRERLCDPEQKATMVAAVNDYLGRVDAVIFTLGLQGAPMRLFGAATGNGEVQAGSTIYDMTKDDTVDFMATYQKRVAVAVRVLASEGIMAPSDFGTFMGVPETILSIFGTTAVKKRACG
jgi:hypothetical protein